MKKYFIVAILFAITMIYGCNFHDPQTNDYQEICVTFVADCTDPELFSSSIDPDFRTHLNPFFKTTKLCPLDFGKMLTVKMLPLEASGTFSSKKASIGPAYKWMSTREAAACRDTSPLRQLIASELNAYKTLSESNMKNSSILETLLKTFIDMDPEAEKNIIVVLTDGIEHSGYLNMYRSPVPTKEDDIKNLAKKLDNFLVQDASSRIEQTGPVVVMVLKKNEKVNTSNLKQFYSLFFSSVLGIPTDHVLFVDNLGNNILIPEEP